MDDELPDLAELGQQIVALSGRLAAATCRWLLLVAEFDVRRGYRNAGLVSTARWLTHLCGISRRTAVEHVRVARALRAWPRLAEQMRAGRLSYSHVRAISRISDRGDEALLEDLINLALHGTVTQVESAVRGLRTVCDSVAGMPATDEAVTHGWTEASQWRLSARLDPERGAQVQAALAAVAKAEGLTAPDALVRLAEIGLAALADGAQTRTLRGDEQAAIVIHLDASRVRPDEPRSRERADSPRPPDERLTDRCSATPDGAGPRSGESGDAGSRSRERDAVPIGRLADGPGLPTAVIERLACAGRIRTVVHDGPPGRSDILDLGRSHRLVTPRQFQALLLRDGGRCGYPGCEKRTVLQAHYVRHWLHGGRTDLDNLVLLCSADHLAHHDGEFTIQPLGRGRFRYFRNGRELPRRIDPAALVVDARPVEDEQSQVSPAAATPKWDGTRMDHDWAVTSLAQHLCLADTG